LDFSFNEIIVRDPVWLSMFAGAIEEMEHHIRDAFSLGPLDADMMRDRIPLDSIPFKHPKRRQRDIHSLPKDDDVRVAFQALFLFLLRPFVPLKCKLRNKGFTFPCCVQNLRDLLFLLFRSNNG
jgi:hypothetical protein